MEPGCNGEEIEGPAGQDPSSPLAWARFGAAHLQSGAYDEGIEAYRISLELDEGQPAVWNNLGVALSFRGQVRSAIECFERAVYLSDSIPQAYSNLLLALNYDPATEPKRVFERHQGWAAVYGEAAAVPSMATPRSHGPGEAIRVGYVSGALHEHSNSYTLRPILEAHARPEFHVTCYTNSSRADAVTRHLEKTVDRWREIYGRSDDEAAALIRADAILVLVDVDGHTEGNRLTLFARKPAPVQVTWCGYPNTSGLRAMDYRFTCALSDPPGATEHLHTEELVRLPCFICYQPPNWAPPVGPLPALNRAAPAFGCFSSLPKICDMAIKAWARILATVPASRLILKSRGYASAQLRQSMNARFRALGVDPERVEMIEFTARPSDHLDLYNRVDVALDTWPYNGTVTTMEALWMGVPVISMAGRVHVARVGLSMLTAVGLGELVAFSDEEYVAKAVELARNLPRLETLRDGMRARLTGSPLMAYTARARDMETAYRWMVARAYGKWNS